MKKKLLEAKGWYGPRGRDRCWDVTTKILGKATELNSNANKSYSIPTMVHLSGYNRQERGRARASHQHLKTGFSAKRKRPQQKNPGPPSLGLSVKPAIWPRKNQIAMKSTPENKPSRFWRWPKLRPKAMKLVLQLGLWNVQIMFLAGKMQETANKLKKYNIHISALQETWGMDWCI